MRSQRQQPARTGIKAAVSAEEDADLAQVRVAYRLADALCGHCLNSRPSSGMLFQQPFRADQELRAVNRILRLLCKTAAAAADKRDFHG